MKTLTILIILCLFTFTGTSQTNLIPWNLTNDSLVNPWYVGADNDSEIQDSAQYVNSPFACIFGQVLNIPNPYGRTFRLEYDLASNAFTQCHIWITPTMGYVVNAPNPMPINTDMTHYSMEFTYMQDTLYSIEFRTIPNFATWIKIRNVSMVEVFPVGIETVTSCNALSDQIYSYPQGRKLDRIPTSGWYIQDRKLHYIIQK